MRVLMIGPSPTKSKGGMATVIKEIQEDKEMNDEFHIDYYSSFVDGNFLKRFMYSICAFLKFYFFERNYDIYHIHLASRGSTFRKGYYIRSIKRWNKKVIAHIHGAQYMEFFSEISSSKQKLVIEILNSADTVVALSKDWKDKFDSTFGLSNCIVIENGISVETYEATSTSDLVEDCSFLCLGRLGKRKGSYDIVDAVSLIVNKNPNIKVYLAGDGEIEQVKKKILNNGLDSNIMVVGWVDMRGKLDLLSKVSTVILPSYNEGLPMSILEGMAAGKAIISTNVGAIPEVVGNDNGIIIEPGDIKALADALSKLCGNSNQLRKYGTNNIALIENRFSTKIMHKKIGNLYHELLKI